jgi:tetratricopeptide (TPR) repeat protein
MMIALGAVLAVGGQREEELSVHDALEPRFERVSEPARSRVMAIHLLSKRAALRALGRFADEVAVCDAYLERFASTSDPETANEWPQVALARVNALHKLGRLDGALASTDAMIARLAELRHPEAGRFSAHAHEAASFALLYMAKLAMKQGDAEGARAYLEAAATRSDEARRELPLNPVVLGNAGYIAFLRGREEEARAFLGEAFRLGGSRIRQGEFEDSRVHEVAADEAFRALLSSLQVKDGGSRTRARRSGRGRKER